MNIEQVSVDKLKHAEYNPRKISPEDFEQIKTSIEKFGLVQPLVANKAPGREGVVIGGNQRLEVMKKLGKIEADVVWVDIPDLEREKELNIRLNRNQGQFDWNLLQQNFEIPDLKDWGFSLPEINTNFEISQKEETQEVPELPKEPRAKRGEVYILGRHRILCGDSTDAGDVALLMDGKKADLIFTDPPYSVNYASRKENPDQTLKSYIDPKDSKDLLYNFLSIAPSNCLIMTYSDKQLHPYVLTLEKLGWETIDLLIWYKQNFCFWPGARYQQQHELIFLARKKGKKFYSNTPANRSTVFEVDRKMKNDVHPTERPVSLWGELISYHAKEGDLIYEPFCGSGTTLIVCEQKNITCFAIEISPEYCDVIIKRFCNFTGANEDEIYNSAVQVVQENSKK